MASNGEVLAVVREWPARRAPAEVGDGAALGGAARVSIVVCVCVGVGVGVLCELLGRCARARSVGTVRTSASAETCVSLGDILLVADSGMPSGAVDEWLKQREVCV